jgi:hypothetical protein
MRDYSLTHLSDAVLLRDLGALIAHDRVTTAAVLAHVAEVDARRLYAPAGYPSMHAYCVGELCLSEDAAFRRIRAARAGREFPALFAALAEGRLHLAAMSLLAPHLTRENIDELIERATHRRKSEIEEMLARTFPCSEGDASLHAVPALSSEVSQLVPGRVGTVAPVLAQLVPGHVDDSEAEAAATAESFLLKLTIGKSMREKLRYAQDLLSHAVPSGDVAEVLDRALDTLIVELEKQKLGAGTRRKLRSGAGTPQLPVLSVSSKVSRAQLPSRSGPSARICYVPARVRRAVWERDGGRCTFVSAAGHRCESRRFLEFDHIDPVARGGRATPEGMRLRCRTHNQYEAECAFGAGFMSQKRHEARHAAKEAHARAVAEARAQTVAEARARNVRNMPRGMLEVTGAGERDAKERAAREQVVREQVVREQVRDVWAGLRNLGARPDQARRAAALTGTLQGVTLEERIRTALRYLNRS